MQLDVYADILFLINFSMDYLCLYISAKIMHRRMITWRMLLAAAAGGLYSVLSILITIPIPLGVFIDCLICVAICAIAFCERGKRLSSLFLTAFLYLGISMMTGGCMTAIFNLLNKLSLPLDLVGNDGITTYLFAFLAAVAGLISLKSGQLISRKGAIRECKIALTFQGNEFEFSGFSDSGNLVRDPISGMPVIFLDRSELEKKCSLSFLDDFANGKLPHDVTSRGLRIISFNTASGTSIAVAARPEQLTLEYCDIKGRKCTISPDVLIAATNIGSSAQGYNAIVPSEIITG